MAHYLVQLSYTPEAWATQLSSPTNRVEIVSKALAEVNARFVDTYFAFGDYDLIFVMEAPDNVTAAALALAITAGGALKSYKTTPLLTIEEGIAAMRAGAKLTSVYQPPTR